MSLDEEASEAIDRLFGKWAQYIKPAYSAYLAGQTSLLEYVKRLYKVSLDEVSDKEGYANWLGIWDEENLEIVGLKKVGEFSDDDRRWSRMESVVLAPVDYDKFSDSAGPAIEIYYDHGLTEYQDHEFNSEWAREVLPTKVTEIVWTDMPKNTEGK